MEYYSSIEGNKLLEKHNNMDESHIYNAEWKNKDIKVHTVWLHLHEILDHTKLIYNVIN